MSAVPFIDANEMADCFAMADDLQRSAAATGLSTEALAALALADFVIKLRRKRRLKAELSA